MTHFGSSKLWAAQRAKESLCSPCLTSVFPRSPEVGHQPPARGSENLLFLLCILHFYQFLRCSLSCDPPPGLGSGVLPRTSLCSSPEGCPNSKKSVLRQILWVLAPTGGSHHSGTEEGHAGDTQLQTQGGLLWDLILWDLILWDQSNPCRTQQPPLRR